MEQKIPQKNNNVLEFIKFQFEYNVTYSEQRIHVMARHCEKFYEWEKIIERPIESETDRTVTAETEKSNLSVTLAPDYLFILLSEDIAGTLHPMYKFIYQEKMKDSKEPLIILFESKLPHDKEPVRKRIVLEPLHVSDCYRLEAIINKTGDNFQQVNKEIEKEINNIKDSLTELQDNMTNYTELDEFHNKLKTLSNELKEEVKILNAKIVAPNETFVKQTDFSQSLRTFVKQIDLLALDNKYLKLTDTNAYATKEDVENVRRYATTVDNKIVAPNHTYAAKVQVNSLEIKIKALEDKIALLATKEEITALDNKYVKK